MFYIISGHMELLLLDLDSSQRSVLLSCTDLRSFVEKVYWRKCTVMIIDQIELGTREAILTLRIL